MNDDAARPPGEEFKPPVSTFAGPIAELIGHGMLAPPSRPGLLASLDGYEVIRILGGGGMGVVLLARDAKTSAQVAIKMVRPELLADQQVLHRFLKEASHLQRLKHANVIEVLAVQDREQGPYFVMPYFEQGSLAKWIRPGEPLIKGVIVDISAQICEALQFAHRRGIIHRDLKPANILLGTPRKACLADFGLARTFFNDTIIDVENQQCEGTAAYMSPAVAAGNAEDTRCDIYGFGAMLYEMLTGQPPYRGRTTAEIRAQILAHPPGAILDLNLQADPGLVKIAEGAMARELRDRYADIGDVLADLHRIEEGKEPLGPRGGLRGNLKKAGGFPALIWVPAAVVLIGLGIWVWSRRTSLTDQKPATVATKSAPARSAQTPASTPAVPVPVPQPEPTVKTNPPIAVEATPAPVPFDNVAVPPADTNNYAAVPPSAAVLDYLHTSLAPYGKWIDVPNYGSCWRPSATMIDPKWRPYNEQGRWFYTEFGWFWHSDYSWGPTVFHYGRWFQYNGSWVWLPGYEWAPAWVCWREAEGYFGWAPLPPAATFDATTGLAWKGKPAPDSDFGLGADAFTFVSYEHFLDHDLHNEVVPRDQVEALFKSSAIKNGYRIDQGKLLVEGPGRDRVATVMRHEVTSQRPFIRDIKAMTGN